MAFDVTRVTKYLVDKWPDVFSKEADILSNQTTYPDFATLAMDIAKGNCLLCNECELHKGYAPVWADGTVLSDVVVVAEGPGQFEERTGIPFTSIRELNCSFCYIHCAKFPECYPKNHFTNGVRLPNLGCVLETLDESRPQGRCPKPHTVANIFNEAINGLFTRNSWLYDRDLSLPRLYITNVAKCRTANSEGKDVTPDTSTRNNCRKYLDIQLFLIQPKVVILLGAVAGQAFLGSKYLVTKHSGEFYEVNAKELGLPNRTKFIGTAFHPSAISRATEEDNKKRFEMFDELRYVFVRANEEVTNDNASRISK